MGRIAGVEVTERTFTLTLTDAKRLTILHALGFMYAKLDKTPPVVTEAVLGLIGELTTAPGKDQTLAQVTGGGTAPAHAILGRSPSQTLFARDRKGDSPTSAPTGAELGTYRIVGTAKTAKYLKVILANKGTANCFDSALWPLIEKREGQDCELWLTKSTDGKYLNIVGVRV